MLCVMILCLQVLGLSASSVAEKDPAVPYGITISKDGQYIPVFDKIDSGKRIDLLMPEQLCALDFSKLQGRYYWYHIVYLDDTGNARAGYVKESNFEQLTASSLAQYMTDPVNAVLISQLIALSESSPLFIGESQTVQASLGNAGGYSSSGGNSNTSGNSSSSGNKKNYILNTNTHKFHLPGCKSVKQMKQKNKKSYTGTREDIINMGYSPCKNCNP